MTPREDSSGQGRPGRGGSQGSGGRGGQPGRPAGRGSSSTPVGGGQSRGGQSRGGQDREERGGTRLTPKSPRLPEPAIADGITGKELDRSVWTQLRTLSKENAQGVAQHLVMVAALLDDDLDAAEAHAETAVRRAGRVPAAREALGLVAYRKGEWSRALGEFRTVRRLSGSSHLLPLMVDCERGLGRLDRALDLASSPEARTLARDERVELAIVVSGIRRDLGQKDAAAAGLDIPELKSTGRKPWSARLFYAYAEALLALGETEGAREWFAHAVDADDALDTDAAERLDELDGVAQLDLLETEDDELGDRGLGDHKLGDHKLGDHKRGDHKLGDHELGGDERGPAGSSR